MNKNIYFKTLLCLIFPVLLMILTDGCNKSDSDKSKTKTYEILAKNSPCYPLVITIVADQTVTITATDSVHTNEGGSVVDCDMWTNANGIPDCHYVIEEPKLHGLPFMALVGKFDGDYFLVGTHFTKKFTTSDNLELWVNDWGDCGDDSDNSGKFVVTVKIE